MGFTKGSTRHAKITGDFAENLVLYWLSKDRFECALVDHTGIDIIARNPHTNEVMGISVKSRCRSDGREEDYITVLNTEFDKVAATCKAFACTPYSARASWKQIPPRFARSSRPKKKARHA